jgi:hypothetical protein
MNKPINNVRKIVQTTLLNSVSNDLLPFMVGHIRHRSVYTAECHHPGENRFCEFMEFHGKIRQMFMRNTMEIPRNSVKLYGTPGKFRGIPWNSVEFHETKDMEFHG